MKARIRVHEPGSCPDSLYGQDCDGWAEYRPDPFAMEIYDASFDDPNIWDWYCSGVLVGRHEDI